MSKPNLRKFLYKFEPDVLDPPNLREIASRKGWTTSLAGPLVVQVERDILTFDSFAAVAELSNGRLQFGGGTLLNWAYAGSSPRFSFDIDSQILEPRITKQKILSELVPRINDQLRENGKVIVIPFSGKNVEMGTIEYDKKKDHFPDVLSLKRRVFSLTVGTEAHVYLHRELGLTGDFSKASVRLKEYLGGSIPRIEDVPIEIGIPESREQIFPRKTIEVRPLVYPEVPAESVKAAVTEREYVMALKIFKLGKDFTKDEERYALNDFVKSICDLSACANSYSSNVLSAYLDRICKAKKCLTKEVVKTAKRRSGELSSRKEAKKWFEQSGQTSFLARSSSFAELTAAVDIILSNVTF